MSRPRPYALCSWVLGAQKCHIYSKYHVADFGNRYYFCECGQEFALKAKLCVALGHKEVMPQLKWRICHRNLERKGKEYLGKRRGPYGTIR
jgi:hypothetical protein